MTYAKRITLKPIGIVSNGVFDLKPDSADNLISEIILNHEYVEALEGIDQFSHLIVVFWMHLIPSNMRHLKKIHPRGRKEIPMRGVLATRTQYRPNPLGIKTVRLLERKENVLKVKGLDALDGTPLLDIKPYDPLYDGAPEAKVPKWIESLHKSSQQASNDK